MKYFSEFDDADDIRPVVKRKSLLNEHFPEDTKRFDGVLIGMTTSSPATYRVVPVPLHADESEGAVIAKAVSDPCTGIGAA